MKEKIVKIAVLVCFLGVAISFIVSLIAVNRGAAMFVFIMMFVFAICLAVFMLIIVDFLSRDKVHTIYTLPRCEALRLIASVRTGQGDERIAIFTKISTGERIIAEVHSPIPSDLIEIQYRSDKEGEVILPKMVAFQED